MHQQVPELPLLKRLPTRHCAAATIVSRGSINVGQGLASPVCQAGGIVRSRNRKSSGGRRRQAGTGAAERGRLSRGFVWGTATSSYQVEGAVDEDGRGASIWDKFVRIPGKIEDGTTGDRANEHYHRYKEDIALIKELGCKAYRFSVAWPRLFPDGDGKPNPKGLDFYNRLVDELLKNGIEPWLTLYHWDLPQSLQDRFGGWRSTETCKIFGDYAAYVAEHLTDRVKNVFTLNESGRFVHFGYGIGIDAPGVTLPQAEVNQIRHNSALAHGLAVQAVRAHGRRGTRVGPAENIDACVPAIDTPEHVRAAEIALREMNAGYLNVIMTGRYTDAFLKYAGRRCAEIHRRRAEDHLLAGRLPRPQHLRAAELCGGLRPGRGLHAAADPEIVPAHEFELAARRRPRRSTGCRSWPQRSGRRMRSISARTAPPATTW